jgi:hypothetical protein
MPMPDAMPSGPECRQHQQHPDDEVALWFAQMVKTGRGMVEVMMPILNI